MYGRQIFSDYQTGFKTMKQWYEELFENYAMKYDSECFVHGTAGECDFIEKEIKYNTEF